MRNNISEINRASCHHDIAGNFRVVIERKVAQPNINLNAPMKQKRFCLKNILAELKKKLVLKFSTRLLEGLHPFVCANYNSGQLINL